MFASRTLPFSAHALLGTPLAIASLDGRVHDLIVAVEIVVLGALRQHQHVQ